MATQATDSSKYRLRTNASDELAVIAQRAQAFTNASGAAIALSEGNVDEIVCRARSGSSAPDVGVTLRVEGSFTGLCIQSGKELRCDDAETDTRVDTVAIRALGIRSMVVTPVKDDNKVVGVLAVFAATPHAFTITHVAVLKTMADQISALLLKERRARDEGVPIEPVVTAPRPPAPATPPPAPVMIKSNGSNGSGAAVAMAPVRVAAAAPKIEIIKAPAVEPPAPVPFPRREEKRVEPAHEPVAKANFGTFDAMAGEQKQPGSNKFLVVGIAVVVAVIAVGSWLLLRKGSSTAQPNAPVTAAVTPAPAPVTPATTTGTPAATSTATAAPPPPVANTTQPNPKPAPPEAKPENKRPEALKPEARPAPAAPATVAVTGGTSRISTSAAAQQPTQEVAPSLSAGNSGPSALSSLARPVGSSAPAMMAQSELIPVQLIHSVPAAYPAIAKARRLNGTVIVKVNIDKAGKVTNPRLVSGPVIFRDSAFEAVTQWRYKPATLNGQPVEQEQEIKMTFKP